MRKFLKTSNPNAYLLRLFAFSFALVTLFFISCSNSEESESEYEIPREEEVQLSTLAPDTDDPIKTDSVVTSSMEAKEITELGNDR